MQLTGISLSHQCFSPSPSLSLPLSLKLIKNISSDKDENKKNGKLFLYPVSNLEKMVTRLFYFLFLWKQSFITEKLPAAGSGPKQVPGQFLCLGVNMCSADFPLVGLKKLALATSIHFKLQGSRSISPPCVFSSGSEPFFSCDFIWNRVWLTNWFLVLGFSSPPLYTPLL